jgi:hypothetical protein
MVTVAAALGVSAVLPWDGAFAGGTSMALPRRAVSQAAGAVRLESAATGFRPSPRAAASAAAQLFTVDAASWTGYENAVYAPDGHRIFVAYKRFLSDPTIPGYTPAELRVARSLDGGRTWSIQVVDPDAIETGDTIENSVSIDGDGASTIYVAYHVRASGAFADMKLRVAKSTDVGATWTTQTVADSSAGDYNATRVIDANAVVIGAHVAGAAEGPHAFVTRNGGSTWLDSPIAGGLGNGWYTSVGAVGLGSIFVSYYNGLYPDHTDANVAHRTGGAWLTTVVDGTPGDADLTGLGGSVTVASGPTVWTAYEADTAQGAFVRVAKRAGSSWTITPVEQGLTIGWNTAIHAVGTDDVYVSYWRFVGSLGQAAFAVSTDGGATWTPSTVPETRNVNPYLDSDSPSSAVQFVSYQATTGAGATVLRLARIQPTG